MEMEATPKTPGEALKSFEVKDCALAAIATGKRAHDLREFRDNLATIHQESIYYHFWGGLMRPKFDNPEFYNDFASWAQYGLQDSILAERLGILHPTDYPDIEVLRTEVLDVIDERLDETDGILRNTANMQFYFVRSQLVIFDTKRRFNRPEELGLALGELSTSSIFYHFVDAHRRSPEDVDDFSAWIKSGFEGYDAITDELSGVDPFFSSLTELRQRLANIFQEQLR